jgi:N-acetylmuramic acid 6-phosphate (MurNAc-6-P) etherase
MPQDQLSITETPNELTNDIDIAGPLGIVRLFRQSDAQILNGWQTYPALLDLEILEKVERAVSETARLLRFKGEKKIIISGAGTSGRLAMFAARTFNEILRAKGFTPLFEYLIAGGDKALIRAQEGAEDDPHQAVRDLRAALGSAQRALYIGVTCGFSAPYIAGQLDYAKQHPSIFSVLLGFNPPERARNSRIENWNKTFRDVVYAIQKKKHCLILNPIVGPEPITGSTRMKGGSATKLLLEVIFSLALLESGIVKQKEVLLHDFSAEQEVLAQVKKMIRQYEAARLAAYDEEEPLADLIERAGETLRRKGHIYYLGYPPFGILGTVDASECPPTFGADFEDVRGFIFGGWKGLLALERDLSSEGTVYRIDAREFEKVKLPRLGKNDLVIGLGMQNLQDRILTLLRESRKRGAAAAAVIVNANRRRLSREIQLCVAPHVSPEGLVRNAPIFAEYAMKLVLNAITTGGHVLTGKVYQNRMVDLRISNNKLFYRTVRIVSNIMSVSEHAAQRAVLRSIYNTDTLTHSVSELPISSHIDAARGQEKLVPKALLLSTGQFTCRTAAAALRKEPIVRNIILAMANEQKEKRIS